VHGAHSCHLSLSLSLCFSLSVSLFVSSCLAFGSCPHWHRGSYGVCSQQCMNGASAGIQNRTLVCRQPHDNVTYGVVQPDTTLCPAQGVGDVGDGVGQAGVKAVRARTR
jgi:hypothetical protein